MLKFYVKVFYVMGKALSGELSCPCVRSCLNMEVCCVILLKSPQRGDSNEYTQYIVFNIK